MFGHWFYHLFFKTGTNSRFSSTCTQIYYNTRHHWYICSQFAQNLCICTQKIVQPSHSLHLLLSSTSVCPVKVKMTSKCSTSDIPFRQTQVWCFLISVNSKKPHAVAFFPRSVVDHMEQCNLHVTRIWTEAPNQSLSPSSDSCHNLVSLTQQHLHEGHRDTTEERKHDISVQSKLEWPYCTMETTDVTSCYGSSLSLQAGLEHESHFRKDTSSNSELNFKAWGLNTGWGPVSHPWRN